MIEFATWLRKNPQNTSRMNSYGKDAMSNEALITVGVTIGSGVVLGLLKIIHGNLSISMNDIKQRVTHLNENMNTKFSDLDKKLAVSGENIHYLNREVEELKKDMKSSR